jgi:membrane-anchored glycerophosphoryl diester phosphodiesterase (GDPDase)
VSSTTSTMLKASFRVLRQNKRLLVVPSASIAAQAVVVGSFVVPYVMTKHGSSADAMHLTPTADVMVALCVLVTTAVSLFFSAALFLATADALNAEEVNIGAALRGAARRLPAICAWAALSCTLALVLRLVDRRVPFAAVVFNVSWSCVSYLALPVMVFEGVGVPRALRRSAEIFRRTWREQTFGPWRLAGIATVLVIPALIVFVIGIGTVTASGIILSIGVCVLWFGLCSLVVSCLTGVFRVAVYRFAVSGVTPEQFSALDLGRAFA